jgi:hypothetical protein
VSLISEEVYKSIIATGYAPFKVSRTFEVYTGAFTWSIDLITKIVLLEFKINGDVFQHSFRITAQQGTVLLGEDFLLENKIVIYIHEECFRKGEKEYVFSSTTGKNVGENETNGGKTDHTTDAHLPSTLPTQPASHAQPTPLPSRQKPELEKRPFKVITFGKARMLAVVDTGSKVSAISKAAYKLIKARGYKGLKIPGGPALLSSGQSHATVKKQFLLEFKIDGDVFEDSFWVTSGLTVPVILGEDFLRENRIAVDFQEKCFRKGENENNRIYRFISTKEINKWRQ